MRIKTQQRIRSWLAYGLGSIFVLALVMPLIWVVTTSVRPLSEMTRMPPLVFPRSITFDAYIDLWETGPFLKYFMNSVVISLSTAFIALAFSICAAYAFARFRFRGRDGAMFAFLLVQMFPGIIILVPYFMVMKSLGLLNTSLGLILAYSVTALPLCVWMLKGFFDTIPRELEEAALLDGCNQFQVFWKIVLPLSLPAVAVTALFSFLAAWNEFLLALTFNSDEAMFTLPVGLASMIGDTGAAWGDFAAASLLVSLPVVILFIVFQKFLIQGLSAGSVKG